MLIKFDFLKWTAIVLRIFIIASIIATAFLSISPVYAASGPGTYDDNVAGWTYTGSWSLYSGSGPFKNNTVHYTSGVGNSASFTFDGTGFVLTYSKDSNRGNIGVYVDGNLVATINAYSEVSQYQSTYTSPSYTSSTHTVEFRNEGGGGGYIDVDEIEVKDASAVLGAGIYDDNVGGWTYNGSWSFYNGSGPFKNNTVHYTSGVGNNASFTFNGTGFVLTYSQDPNRGNMGVYVDGNLVTTINANGAAQYQKTYPSPSYTSGIHTVEFRNAGGGGGYIDVDEIEIKNGSSIPGAGTYDDNVAGWTYNGSWSFYNGSGPFKNNTVHYTSGVGNNASFTFNGTGFVLTYSQDPNRGNMGVYVDGNLVTTINANGAAVYQKTYSSPAYENCNHTVEFRNAGGGGGYIDVDEISIVNAGGTACTIDPEPDLTVSLNHTGGGFQQGEVGRTFTIIVTNSGGAPTTGDQITVVSTLPAGLTATAINGTGWSCILGTRTCTRSDSQDTGLPYPVITLTVDAADEIAASSVIAQVSVAGGGETNTSNNTDSDEVSILKPDLVILSYQLTNASDAVITTPQPDATFNIKMTVKNQGTAPTGTFYPGVFLDDKPNYGPDTTPFGRVSDWSGYRRTPVTSVSGAGCIYYDPTDTIEPLVTPVNGERGNYTRTSYNSSLAPGEQTTVAVSISYPSGDYPGSEYDAHRTGLPAGTYSVYLYADPNCSGGSMESNEDNTYGPINITVSGASSALGPGTYDDNVAGWTFTGSSWLLYNGSGPFKNNTVHYTPGVGNSALFTFNGTGFVLTYSQDPNRGNMGVYVDGNLVTTINANGAAVYQKTYTSPSYTSGIHTVEFRNAGGGGGYIDVDAIEIKDASAVPGAGNYDDNVAGWTYNGSWSFFNGSGPFKNNTVHYTSGVGNSAFFTFNGTGFKLTYSQDPNRGNMGVYMDGNLVTTINANGAAQYQKTYSSPFYASGIHTVEFRNAGGGGGYIDVDEIEIKSGSAVPGAGVYDDNAGGWTYNGSWSFYSGAGSFKNNTVHYTSGVGNSALFTFNGTGFTLIYSRDPNRGNIGVYVDGNLVTTLNAYSATSQYQSTYTSPSYTSGVHTVEFRNAGGGGGYIDVDEIQIQ